MNRLKFLVIRLSVCFTAIVFYSACTNNEKDFANPLDPYNLRTAGSPIGLTLAPGDGKVTVSWQNIGNEGIAKYRIYRRFTGDLNFAFELVGEVEAPATTFTDEQNIINDAFDEAQGKRLFYEYRISYVDENGVETPNPTAPPSEDEEPRRIWPMERATPSNPPPIPNVVLGDPTDLSIKLLWDDYEHPDDFEFFRVSAAIPENGKPLRFKLLSDGVRTAEQTFYFDEGIFNDRISGFSQDGIRKIYRIAAVDRFGVEAVKTIEAVSPNLPPAAPKNFSARYRARSLFNNKYDAILSWKATNKEPDLAGYQIYATNEVGGPLVPGEDLVPRQRVDARDSSVTVVGESPIRVGQSLVLRQYFITAFDDTPKPDGTPDQSPLVAAPLPQ
ncbi:MAG: hypothetical protein ACE1ZS_12045 [Candidatus Poribacteria bacterium]